MGEIIKQWVKEILTEDIKKEVVVYAGRFQPFHRGHYDSYQHLVKRFGKDNVYIGTSDKTDKIKSPFKFKEKKMIMMKMFGIPSNKIVQIKNPYAPKEIIGKFDKDTTAFVTVVGEKDRYRLKGKYFEPYHPDKIEKGYDEKGYVYVTPSGGGGMSGTKARELLSKGTEDQKKAGFKQVYNGKFDPKIFKFITDRLTKIYGKMERFLSTFDMVDLINESSSTKVSIGGNSQGVDDGPGFTYGNSKTYKKVGDDAAEALGWEVVDYILGTDEDSIYADDARSIEDKYPVSYFPSGIDGLDSQSIRYIDLKGNSAYKTWAKHITNVATTVGYKLIDFLDAEESIDDTKDAPTKELSPKQKLKEGLITEGGAYGHMNHPFDIEMNLTFGDLKTIIRNALNGNLEFAREKTDGQALAISWRDDKGLIAARNKGHLKNSGENALDISGVASKFQGRGGLTDAYNFAMKDLSDAIKGLSKAQRDKIFKQGSSFMNLEVIYPTSVNVIPYGQPLLIFHGTMDYDENGKAIGADTSSARTLAGMIKQINKDVQNNYTIQGPPVTELPKSKNLSSLQSKFEGQLKKIQSEFKLKDSDGVADYHQAWWEDWVEKNSPSQLDNKAKMGLVKRWAFFDKGFRLDKKNITDSDVLDWAKKTDKQDHSKMAKDNLRKFEDIFLGVGAEVLSFMSSVITVNPDKAIRDMKKRLDTTIKDVQKSGDVKKIEKLRTELERLSVVGGKDKIVPNEGIVFVYKGNTYKLTGAFASLNQLLGLMYF
tara:strand:- start:530 stop:2827 length:2298 start_codon:yes stop_codon:yes gene_type:complete